MTLAPAERSAVRPRLLYLAPASPWPENFGGAMRVSALWRALGAACDTELIVIGDDPGVPARQWLAEQGAELLVSRAEGSAGRALRIGVAAALGRSIPAARYMWPARRRDLLRRIAHERPDVVVLGDTFLGELVPWLVASPPRAGDADAGAGVCRPRVVIDTFNVESQLWRGVADGARSIGERAAYGLLAANTARLERRALPQADRVWAASDEDADWYRRQAGMPAVEVLPNVIEVGEPAPPEHSEPGAVVFTGLMAYAPNDEAARFLVGVSAALAARGVAHHTYVVGREPSALLRSCAAAVDSVTVTGAVESVEPWLARAEVFVAPLAAGSGTKFKLLQAMAAGRAVMTTPTGAAGLGIRDDEHAVVCPRRRFIDELAGLLGDAPRRRRLAEAGYRHVQQRFTQAALERSVRASLASLISGRAGPGRPGDTTAP